MRKILLSMTLLMMSSGVALASNPFPTIRAEREISSVNHFINYNRGQTPVVRDNNMGRGVIHANYAPRQPMRQINQQMQKRAYYPPRGEYRTQQVRRPIQRVQPRFNPNVQPQARVQPRFNPNVQPQARVQPRFNPNVQPQARVQPRFNPNVQPQARVQPRFNPNIQPQARIDFNPNSKFAQAQRAAKMGNKNAEFDLAMMYANGDGVQKNPRLAFNLFHRAARKGHVGAMYCMGVNFEKGLGVIPQQELARHWYGIASRAGNQQAKYKLAQLSQKPQQLNQGQFRNVRYSRR